VGFPLRAVGVSGWDSGHGKQRNDKAAVDNSFF
jgi:hypothetical protein